MSKTPELTDVSILTARRLNCSVNGNPRFDITFFDGDGEYTYRTSSDSACNYDVENLLHSRDRVNVYVTRAGRVYRMDRI